MMTNSKFDHSAFCASVSLCLKFIFALSVLCGAQSLFAGETNLMRGSLLLRGSSFFAEKDPNAYMWLDTYYYDKICDGDDATYWKPMELRGPHFIEMLWRHPVQADQLEWSTENVPGAVLSFWEKGKWVPVSAEIAGDKGRVNFTVQRSARWRFDLQKPTNLPKVFELKLSGPEQYLLPMAINRVYDRRIATSDVQIPSRVYAPGDRVQGTFKTQSDRPMDTSALLIEIRPNADSSTLFQDEAAGITTAVLAEPDADGNVKFDLELPPWTPHGTNDLMVSGIDKASSDLIPCSPAFIGSIEVKRPGHPDLMPPMKTVSVGRNDAGQLGFLINGQWHPAFFNRFYGTADPERYAVTRKTGLNIMYWQCRWGLPVDDERLNFELNWFDRRIRMALSVNPQNYFILSVDLRAGDRWKAAHPTELMMLEDGTPNPMNKFSFGSELYQREVEEYMKTFIRFIKSKPYADRVIGYHVWSCTQNDGFVGGSLVNREITDRKDFILGDFNPGVFRQFRAFLRKKYGNDLSALRKAWRNDAVTFETASVTRAELIREDPTGGPFRDPVSSRPAIDYLEFFPHLIGDFNRRVAALIKRETDGQALVLIHSGAIKDSLAYFNMEQLHANNNDLGDLIADPNIDAFVQAQNYTTRSAGNPVSVYQPTASIALHDKLYLFDYDHRTIGAGTLKTSRHRSQYETKSIFERDLAYQWIDNAGAWIADMSIDQWEKRSNESLPWYTMPQVWASIKRPLKALREDDRPRASAAEIAVVLSLNSPRYEDAQRMTPLYKALVHARLYLFDLPQLGAPHDVLLTSDLGHPKMKDYKLYIFMNPTYFTPKERAEIEKLKRDGKVLMWFYAPGYATDDGLSLEAVKELTGFELKMRSSKTEVPQMTYSDHSVLSQGLAGKKLAATGWDIPLPYPNASLGAIFSAERRGLSTIGGCYADDTVAFAAKDFGKWKSVWCGVPNFERDAWVNLCRYAGVHLYAEAPVVLHCDNRFMMIHNGYDGPKTVTVTLPRPAKVSDLLSEEEIADGTTFPVSLRAPETRLLRLDYR